MIFGGAPFVRTLITGSTGGIGRAIAFQLAAAGADVVVHGRRQSAAQEVSHQLKQAGIRSQVILADLREPAECDRLVQNAWQEWGGLDIWINNAGADILTGDATRWPFERKLQELLAVDLMATIRLSREVGRRMKSQGHGVFELPLTAEVFDRAYNNMPPRSRVTRALPNGERL